MVKKAPEGGWTVRSLTKALTSFPLETKVELLTYEGTYMDKHFLVYKREGEAVVHIE